MVESDAVLRALRKARELVALGWTQGGVGILRDCTGEPVAWCAFQALRKALTEAPALGWVCRWFCAVNQIYDIPNWNDAPDRTQQDVIEAFDRAIAYVLEARGAGDSTISGA